ncbi:hypothetical protein [Nocardioides jiangxiensis]|uniref:PKD domain-containing protein n=1 Tax=Nocardioides jiangxiensis TaxID=3064524 RepID=A0ABT9B063_9ACTN|nr:hypothetical protein [Nocardioides sp. WY-20]MDO7867628.1 hypothetical protein [Nocardioides sp. WY-20]
MAAAEDYGGGTVAKPAGSPSTSIKDDQALPACGAANIDADCRPVTSCVPLADSPTGYMLQTVFAFQAGTTDFEYGGPCTPTASQAAKPSLPSLVFQAFRRVPLPTSALRIQPPNGKTLVGLETIFSTRATAFTKTLTLLGKRVELRIRPTGFTWHHGDGTSQATDWAGKAWRNGSPDIDGYITHIYGHTATVHPSVTVTWSAQYRVGSGPWQEVDGTVTRQGPVATLTIVEGEPVLNGY